MEKKKNHNRAKIVGGSEFMSENLRLSSFALKQAMLGARTAILITKEGRYSVRFKHHVTTEIDIYIVQCKVDSSDCFTAGRTLEEASSEMVRYIEGLQATPAVRAVEMTKRPLYNVCA